MKVLIIVVYMIFFQSFTYAENKSKIVKVKKESIHPKDFKYVRSTSSDDDFYYIEITAEELKLIEQARKIFNESKNAPPPSEHMQKKMQDQVDDK